MLGNKDIAIRFCFSKGEGEYIEISKFSEGELADIRKCLSLDLAYFPKEEPSAKIISVQIIYDGITPVEGEVERYFINRDYEYPLGGYPTPVVCFLLDRAMDEKEFLDYINESSYCVRTELMAQDDEEPYFAEDHNGYSSVLSSNEREQLISSLRANDAYCGKRFEFPAGMPECGHLIPAMDFARKPGA